MPKGEYTVRFYNEKGATAYLRSSKGGFVSGVPPVFTVTVRHKVIKYSLILYFVGNLIQACCLFRNSGTINDYVDSIWSYNYEKQILELFLTH